MTSLRMFILLGITALAAGCNPQNRADEVAKMFEGRRVGDSRDAGLFKRASMSDRVGDWDHVATIHGMADDMDLCESIARALTSAADLYSCRLLN